MEQALVDKFRKLFFGLDRAHGVYTVAGATSEGQKVGGRARTVMAEVTDELYIDHLEGREGLGIIPIMDDDCCYFGAVDIDDYDIDIKDVDEFLRGRDIAAIPCRTKSGGIHLYMFFSMPIEAEMVQTKLAELAGAFGHASAELFPKQTRLATDTSVGNWINLPYFNAAETDRYAVYNGKKLSLKQFVKRAWEMRMDQDAVEAFVLEAEGWFSDGPPCLQQLARTGFPEGTRNTALFSLGVYARLKFQDNWEEELETLNSQLMDPPLGYRELSTTIRSLNRKSYFYKCTEPPLINACNKQLCRMRQYGVGSSGDEEIPFVLGSLHKYETEPPYYEMDVDTIQIKFETDDLLNQNRFRKICVERVNKYYPKVKPAAWDKLIQVKLEEVLIIEDVPDDIGLTAQLVMLLDQFLARPPARDKDEIARGKPYIDDDGTAHFRGSDLIKYISNHSKNIKLDEVGSREVWRRLRDALAESRGFATIRERVQGTMTALWVVDALVEYDQELDLPQTEDVPF